MHAKPTPEHHWNETQGRDDARPSRPPPRQCEGQSRGATRPQRCGPALPATACTGLAWLGLLSGLLGTTPDAAADEPGSTTPVHVLNRGVPGNTTVNALARLTRDVSAANPDVVIVFFGMNDALNSGKLVSPKRFEKNLREIVASCRRAGVDTVGLVTPNDIVEEYVASRHPHHPEQHLSRHLERFADIVRKVAGDTTSQLVDLRKAVAGHGTTLTALESPVRNEANAKARDGVHLTPAGYRLLARACHRALRHRVQRGDTVVCFGDSLTYGSHVRGAGTAEGETYPAVLARLLAETAGPATDRNIDK